MEFIKDLGFNPLLLGGQIVNFLIIYFLLKRFAYKPILGLLKKREEDIKTGIKNAEEGKLVLEKALLDEKRILLTYGLFDVINNTINKYMTRRAIYDLASNSVFSWI